MPVFHALSIILSSFFFVVFLFSRCFYPKQLSNEVSGSNSAVMMLSVCYHLLCCVYESVHVCIQFARISLMALILELFS